MNNDTLINIDRRSMTSMALIKVYLEENFVLRYSFSFLTHVTIVEAFRDIFLDGISFPFFSRFRDHRDIVRRWCLVLRERRKDLRRGDRTGRHHGGAW